MKVTDSIIGRELKIVGYRSDIRTEEGLLYCDILVREHIGCTYEVIDYDPENNMIAVYINKYVWLHPGEYKFLVRNLFN